MTKLNLRTLAGTTQNSAAEGTHELNWSMEAYEKQVV